MPRTCALDSWPVLAAPPTCQGVEQLRGVLVPDVRRAVGAVASRGGAGGGGVEVAEPRAGGWGRAQLGSSQEAALRGCVCGRTGSKVHWGEY